MKLPIINVYLNLTLAGRYIRWFTALDEEEKLAYQDFYDYLDRENVQMPRVINWSPEAERKWQIKRMLSGGLVLYLFWDVMGSIYRRSRLKQEANTEEESVSRQEMATLNKEQVNLIAEITEGPLIKIGQGLEKQAFASNQHVVYKRRSFRGVVAEELTHRVIHFI